MRFLLRNVLFISLLSVVFASCKTTRSTQGSALYDPVEVQQLSGKLGIRLSNADKDDDRNMPLYAEASLWLGTPYRYGGQTKKGADCSGFLSQVYKKVYKMSLPRSTNEMSQMKMTKVSKGQLQTGDLVFFATSKDRKRVTHVGLYLKDGYFVHASTRRGVVVDSLEDGYYDKNWVKGGRVR